jgi:ribosomal protein S27E
MAITGMAIRCNGCGSEYEGDWELEEMTDPSGHSKKVCPACDDPQTTFSEG